MGLYGAAHPLPRAPLIPANLKGSLLEEHKCGVIGIEYKLRNSHWDVLEPAGGGWLLEAFAWTSTPRAPAPHGPRTLQAPGHSLLSYSALA